MATIPASQIVSVVPGVLPPGGNALALNGLILSTASLLPTGAPKAFASAASVSAYFGSTSSEADLASVYFSGFDNSLVKPTSLLFGRYADVALSAFMISGSLPSIATLQGVTSGDLTIAIDGVAKSTLALDLSGDSTYSAMAASIATALGLSGGQTCVYSSQLNAFVISSGTTGASSTIGYATVAANGGELLNFTSATGAVLSQGADAVTDNGAFMDALVLSTQNWATFMTAWEPDIAGKQAFSDWTDAQSDRYIYACWDTSATPTGSSDTSSIGYYCKANGKAGTMPLYNTAALAAFVLGIGASIDFTRQNGRTTYAFRSGSGVNATVTDPTVAENLLANGYSFYGTYGTANDSFTWLYNGQISGSFMWADSYLNAIWLNNSLQLDMMTLLNSVGSIPYNQAGYDLVSAAAKNSILAAVSFGAIRPNIPLSPLQAAEVNAAAGGTIDTTLSSRGWYLKVADPGATARVSRLSPSCTLWYMDGQSIQKINLASIAIL